MKCPVGITLIMSGLLLVAGSGCCMNRAVCGGGTYGAPCGPTAGPTDCGPCGRPFLGRLPIALFGWLDSRLSCGAGCGPLYWHEWMMDPPDCCDPCDDCGEWVGPVSGPRTPVLTMLDCLFGRRFLPGSVGCGAVNCTDCGGGCADCGTAYETTRCGIAGCGDCGGGSVVQQPGTSWDGGSVASDTCTHCGR